MLGFALVNFIFILYPNSYVYIKYAMLKSLNVNLISFMLNEVLFFMKLFAMYI
jgi:hypothetical protein